MKPKATTYFRLEPSVPPGCCPFAKSGRLLRVSRWLAPGAILLLIPKCPACLAGYIAVATGLGVSLSVAENLRILALILIAALLIAVLSPVLCRFFRIRKQH